MSKRVTLTDFEIEQLVKGLEYLSKEMNLSYEVIKVGQRFYAGLIKKLQPDTEAERVGSQNQAPSEPPTPAKASSNRGTRGTK